MARHLKIVWAWLAGGLLVSAGSFNVKPVRIEFSARQPQTSVSVTSLGDAPVTIQVHAVAWNPQGTGEVFADSDDILLNPPILNLAPGQTRFVRMGLRRANTGPVETSYRLIFEELPPPPTPGFKGLKTLLRISIPVFALPNGQAVPDLVWRVSRTDENHMKLLVENRGNAHVQIKRLKFWAKPDTEPDHLEATNVYVLPGGSHEWAIKEESLLRAGRLLVEAETDQREMHADLSTENR